MIKMKRWILGFPVQAAFQSNSWDALLERNSPPRLPYFTSAIGRLRINSRRNAFYRNSEMQQYRFNRERSGYLSHRGRFKFSGHW